MISTWDVTTKMPDGQLIQRRIETPAQYGMYGLFRVLLNFDDKSVFGGDLQSIVLVE